MNETTPPDDSSQGSDAGAGTPPGPAPGPPPILDRFFAWLRGLGIVRGEDRWFTGVAGGIAAKAGIDPLIVRGVFVVLALVTGVGVLLYLAGWVLLPDRSGRIHAEELFRGRGSTGMTITVIVIAAILVIPVIVNLLAATLGGPWNWGLWDGWGAGGVGLPGWIGVVLTVLWWVTISGLIIWFIVWVVSRGGATRSSAADRAAASPDGAHGSAARPNGYGAPPAGAGESAWAAPAGRGAEEWGADAGMRTGEQGTAEWGRQWEERAEEWGQQAEEWGQRAEEHHERTALGSAHLVITLALALLAAGSAALWAFSLPTDGGTVMTAGLLAAVAVLAVSLIVAGVRGRRTGWLGFLSFAGVIALIFAPFTVFLPEDTRFVPFGNISIPASADGSDSATALIAGNATVDLADLDGTAEAREVDVWVLAGNVTVRLPASHPVRVQVNLLAGNITDRRDDPEEPRQRGIFLSNSFASGAENPENAEVTQVRIRLLGGNVRLDGGGGSDVESERSAEIERMRQELEEERTVEQEDREERIREYEERLDELEQELERLQ
ncbi:PspC domain-containing protein [Leucobacter weissii]|uniref:PspC domain-containing protein n=1 Tax=Leucobacter weissii TaxID=1983706 RepID=A0A939MPD4_9MICO|nr:PspC domain-containing protein [Leucobacter weissii]MBO1902287.1 PspC domain-containing protein [Leucobacter weissii]